MLFTSAAPTPYDVRFSLLGFPTRITPIFWITALLLGGNGDLQFSIAWVAAVLVSILVHELGHAFLQRFFGGSPEIVLYAFGGYASAVGVRETWWRNVLISLAGPGAGFGLWLAILGLLQAFGPPHNRMADVFVGSMLWINLVWSLLNLAPIWPLDGGRVARELLTRFLKPTTGIVASLVLSIVCATALAAYSYATTGSLWNTLLFALLAYQSYETLQQYRASRGGW